MRICKLFFTYRHFAVCPFQHIENVLKRKICFLEIMVGQSIKCASEKVSQPAENAEFRFHQKLKA